MSAELNVQLRLLLDQVQGDAQKAAEIVKRAMGGAVRETASGGGKKAGKSAIEKDLDLLDKVMRSEERLARFRAHESAKAAAKARQAMQSPALAQDSHIRMYQAMQRMPKPPVIRTPKEKEQFGPLDSFLGMARSLVYYRAITSVMDSFKKSVEALINSINRAASLYSKAMVSGVGLQATTRKTVIAGVLGVNEDEIFRFGNALNYLQPRLKRATDILSSTATPLTQVNWEFKIMSENIKSVFAQIAVDVAPTLLKFASALSAITVSASKFLENPIVQGIISGISTGIFGNLGEILGGKPGEMPAPNQYMKQLPASAWERMGLIVGGGGGTNYAQKTAENTSQMVKMLSIIAKGQFNPHSVPMMGHPSTP